MKCTGRVYNNEYNRERLEDCLRTPRLGKAYLVPENPKYYHHEISPEMDFMVWGVMTCNIHKL